MITRRGALGGTAAALAIITKANAWFPSLAVGGGGTPSSQWYRLNVGGGGAQVRLAMGPPGSSTAMLTGSDAFGVYGGSTVAGTANTQLYTPTNVPSSYQTAPTPYLGSDCFEVAIDPSNASNWWYFSGAQNGTFSALWKSVSAGTNWTLTTYPFTTDYGNGSNHTNYGTQICVDPANSNVVYVGSVTAANLQRTLDGGVTWTVISGGGSQPPTSSSHGFCGIQCDPTSGTTTASDAHGNSGITVTSRVLTGSGGHGVYVSSNGGSTWALVTSSPTSIGRGKMASDGTYWCQVGTGGLVRITTGNTAATISGATGVYAVAINPGNPAQGVAWSSGGGMYFFSGAINGGTPPSAIGAGNQYAIISPDVPWLQTVGAASTSDIAWDPLLTTSSTSLTISAPGSGNQTCTVGTGLNIVAGDPLRISDTGTPTNYMLVAAISYNSGTGSLVFNPGGSVNAASNATHAVTTVITMASPNPGNVFPGMMVEDTTNGATTGKVLSYIGSTLTLAFPALNDVTSGNALKFLFHEGYGGTYPYLGAQLGGSGTFTTWTITKERIWHIHGAGIDYVIPSTTTLAYNDQSFGLETLSSDAIGAWGSGQNLLLQCNDFPFFSVATNPMGATTGLTYITCPGGAGFPIIDGVRAAVVAQTPTTYVACSDRPFEGYTTDGGQTWTAFATGSGVANDAGDIAATTTSRIVITPNGTGSARYSADGGSTWATATGGPTSWIGSEFDEGGCGLCADWVDSNTFYGYSTANNKVYKSTNGGSTWAAGTNALSVNLYQIKAVPGNQGHLVVAFGGVGQAASTTIAQVFSNNPSTGNPAQISFDGGSTWNNFPNTSDINCIGTGASAPGGNGYPSIYLIGWVKVASVWTYGNWRADNLDHTNLSALTYTNIGGWQMDVPTDIAGHPTRWPWCAIGYQNSGWWIYGYPGTWP